MANIVEETENLLILILLFGFIGLIAWLWFKFKNSGNPNLGLNSENVNKWLCLQFNYQCPDGSQDPQWTPADYEIVNNYTPNETALTQAIQEAPARIEDWYNGLQSNPEATNIGSSPLF